LAVGDWRPDGVRVAHADDPWHVTTDGLRSAPVSAAVVIAAQRAIEASNLAASQQRRTGHYDPHDLIASASGNAARLLAARQADEARMRAEQIRRGI
jgi:hypothetical protein